MHELVSSMSLWLIIGSSVVIGAVGALAIFHFNRNSNTALQSTQQNRLEHEVNELELRQRQQDHHDCIVRREALLESWRLLCEAPAVQNDQKLRESLHIHLFGHEIVEDDTAQSSNDNIKPINDKKSATKPSGVVMDISSEMTESLNKANVIADRRPSTPGVNEAIGNVSVEDSCSEQQAKEKTAKMEFIISQFVKEIEQLQSEQMRLQLMLEPLERFRTENKNLKKELELLKVIAREPRSISATNEAEIKRIREQLSNMEFEILYGQTEKDSIIERLRFQLSDKKKYIQSHEKDWKVQTGSVKAEALEKWLFEDSAANPDDFAM